MYVQLGRAIARLPDDMQVVLLGRHQEERSYEDLAAELHRTVSATRVLYTRALGKLRDLLKEATDG